MRSLVIIMIETEQPEGLSARKLIVETAKHNVLTAYNSEDGLELIRRFPLVDAVLIHGLLRDCDSLIAKVLKSVPAVPVIVATPTHSHNYPGATYIVPSHQPAALLQLLANNFGASTDN